MILIEWEQLDQIISTEKSKKNNTNIHICILYMYILYTTYTNIVLMSKFFSFSNCSSRKRRPSYSQDGDLYLHSLRDDDQMDECNAALVLMSLSGSPHSPRQWMLSSSPGSSSASWTSGSDELSDEGAQTGSLSPNRMRTTSLSTSDEGIVMDYNDETPRKHRVSTPFVPPPFSTYKISIYINIFQQSLSYIFIFK